jgi:hypothetical protein
MDIYIYFNEKIISKHNNENRFCFYFKNYIKKSREAVSLEAVPLSY